MERILTFGVGLALAGFLTTVANAQVIYTWEPVTVSPTSSGSLTLTGGSGGTVSDFSWQFDSTSPDTAFTGTATVLGDGNLQLVGSDTGGPDMHWSANASSGTEENKAQANFTFYGDWVPVVVPEPSTLSFIAIGLLGALIIRRRKV